MPSIASIPLYQPDLSGNESNYLLECVKTSWVSGRGPFVQAFEKKLSEFFIDANCSSVCNGTVALHLALHALGVGPGDEVILPSFTYVATANAVLYVGATPVFADSSVESWQISPDSIEGLITSKTKAVIVPHLYGGACDIERLSVFCRNKELLLVEDAAEALGSTFADKPLGTFGDLGTLSFYGNKIITTGEGGALITKDISIYRRIEKLKSQSLAGGKEYWHDELGFNFRMSNITAALGLAQVERLETTLRRKREIGLYYRERFKNLPVSPLTLDHRAKSNFWLYSFKTDSVENKANLIAELKSKGIETRPVFPLVSDMPHYSHARVDNKLLIRDVAEKAISIPSWPTLNDNQIDTIVESIYHFYKNRKIIKSKNT